MGQNWESVFDEFWMILEVLYEKIVPTKERGVTNDKGFAQSLKKDNSSYWDQEQHHQIMEYLK